MMESAPDYIALKRALVQRVDALWQRQILTGEMLERARAGDHVLTLDFEGARFTLSLVPRAELAKAVPADCADADLIAMTKGQPALARGETVAAWFVATEWAGDEPVVEVHGPLRAWRDAHGTA